MDVLPCLQVMKGRNPSEVYIHHPTWLEFDDRVFLELLRMRKKPRDGFGAGRGKLAEHMHRMKRKQLPRATPSSRLL